jgi:predicted DNA-binding transcriptional regulator AlpA
MEETRAVQVAFGWAGGATTDTTERPATEARAPLDSAAAARRLRSRGTERKTAREPRAGTKRRARTPTPTVASTGSPRGAALPPDDELWDVRAAARFLKRSVSWVYHRAEDGTLPVKRIGGWGLRFIPAELRAWVEASGEPRRKVARGSEE